MPVAECPQCHQSLEVPAARAWVCPRCGHTSPPLPPMRVEGSPVQTPPPPPPAPQVPFRRQLASWSYLAGLVALGLFFLSPIGVPFLLGALAVGFGFAALRQTRDDRRGLLGIVLGVAGIAAGGLWIVAS